MPSLSYSTALIVILRELATEESRSFAALRRTEMIVKWVWENIGETAAHDSNLKKLRTILVFKRELAPGLEFFAPEGYIYPLCDCL